VNRHFQTKLAKSKNVHTIKTTAWIPTKFWTVIKTTKCPSWLVSHTHYKSKMADGRHLGKIEKLLYLSRGLSDFDEIWHADAVRHSWPSRPVKNLKFQKSKMAAAAILKNLKIAISRPWFHRFLQNLAHWCSSTLLTIPTIKKLKFRKSKMAATAILKNLKTAISQPRLDRFWQNLAWWCMMMQLDSLDCSDR